MKTGVYILAGGGDHLFEALDPEKLSAKHSNWDYDVRQLAPWSKTVVPGDTGKESETVAWRSDSAAADSVSLICGRCSSTMDALRFLIDAPGLSPWDSLIAVEQLQGRGQRESAWSSPPGNLYVSWYWPDLAEVRGAASGWQTMASLLAGELTAAALESFGVQVYIKWPNDLLINNKKVCGILVEQRGGHLVVGIGLNLVRAPAREDLRNSMAVPAVSLREAGPEVSPLQFWQRLSETGCGRFYQLLEAVTPATFVKLIERRLAWKGEKVIIRKSRTEVFPAEIQGLSPDGGLLISREGVKETIYTGSIMPGKEIN